MKKHTNWKLSVLLFVPFIFSLRFSEDRPFLSALHRDERARRTDINNVKHHGGDPFIVVFETIDGRIIEDYRANYRAKYVNNVFNIPLSKIREICYPNDLNSKDDIFGIRVYFVPKLIRTESHKNMQILIKKALCSEYPGRRFRRLGDERHTNKSNYNLYYQPEISNDDVTAQRRIGAAQSILNEGVTGTTIKGYFIGRHLIMGTGAGKLSGANVVNTHFLRIEIIKNESNILQLLLAVVDNNRNEPIRITDGTRNKIIYCLPELSQTERRGSADPSGSSCVKPCPSNCPD